MRIAAIGDAHLGRSYYPFTTEAGVNQREFDFERSFEASIELALAQEPELIIWLGDIFDHPRPTYRSFRLAQAALARIREHGVKAAVITGNHDTPRLPGKGSPYTVLADAYPEMHFAHRMTYERFDLPGLAIHAVPQTLTVDAALEALAEAARQRRPGVTNLLLTHPRITQLQPKHADINEIEVDAGLLLSDLVLLGHYHTFAQVSEGMWYAGAPDTFSFADEPDRAKGIVVLDTDTGNCRHIPLEGRRPLVTLDSVYALGLSPTELQERLMARAETVQEGAVARVYVESVDPEVWRLIDHVAIRDAAAASLILKMEPTFVSAALNADVSLPTVNGLGAEWDTYLTGQDMTGLDRDRVRRLGHEYLDSATLGGDGRRVLITRLYLRNFRVYEDELELELPPGLVGIYGANGAGKSTLLEAILFTLWGKSRTSRDQIRSSGVGGECITEVEFEHEGHLYLVRRSLKGINSQMSVEAHCDGNLMSTGTRDAERFVESVLGMDDAAFRASVFTEQKQLAAFSNFAPAERRRLVLQLLGITPLDAARDAARKDARELTTQHDRVRSMLPDLDRLRTEAADAQVAAEAAEVAAADEARAADAARGRLEAATLALNALDQRRQEHDGLVLEGRAARQEMDTAARSMAERGEELSQLDVMAGQLEAVEQEAGTVDQAETLVGALDRLANATRRLEAVEVPARPTAPDEEAVAAAAAQAGSLRQELAAASALAQAADAEAKRAADDAAKSRVLDAGGDCPTCGQALGESFATVQAHRQAEADQAQARAAAAGARARELQKRSQQADAAAARTAQLASAAAASLSRWELAEDRRLDALSERDEAWPLAVAAGVGDVLTAAGYAPSSPPPHSLLEHVQAAAQKALTTKREAAGRALVIRNRLEDRPRIEGALAAVREQHDAAHSRVEVLREKVKALGFDKSVLESALAERDRSAGAAEAAGRNAQAAAVKAAQVRQGAVAAASRVSDGETQHAKLGELEGDARHRSRTAELLSEFRNKMVASVGPKLAVQAADLFNELTDHEYELIEVDGENYQLAISDGGQLYGLERFSGSEIDLANLALRVAISEHIHFQSGGSVGLLVLDEVFGPLDDDRKTRMLQALERLKGRFRQVLVVTHDTEIKEQLPNAIEVVKLPGRRATARVLGD